MLKLTDISKTFYPGTPNEREALKDISVSFEKGSFVTIIGGNGAGKSTLLNAIAGVFPLDSGSISLDGEDFSKEPEYVRSRFIGHLLQDPLKGTAPSMTVEENLALAYGQKNRKKFQIGISKREKDFFRSELELLGLGLENRLGMKMGLLSGGQRQAVTLIMATMNEPKLLLLDEHTSALDPATAAKVMELTVRIAHSPQMITFMVTHNIASALEVGNRTIMMNQGKVLIDLSGEERAHMRVEQVLELFKNRSGEILAEDRILFSE